MILRRARQADTEQIFELFLKSQVRAGETGKSSGFFEYQLTPEDIVSRLRQQERCLVLEEDRVLAYGIAYDMDFVRDMLQTDDSDPVHRRISQAPGKAVYIDQLCIQPGMPVHIAGRFTGAWEHILSEQFSIGLVTAVPLEPWRNDASIRYIAIHGFKLAEKIRTDKLTLGLFTKPAWQPGTELPKYEKYLLGNS